MPRRQGQVSWAASAGLRRPSASTAVRLPRSQYSVMKQGGSWHMPTAHGRGQGDMSGAGKGQGTAGVQGSLRRQLHPAPEASAPPPLIPSPRRAQKASTLGWRRFASMPASSSSLRAMGADSSRARAAAALLVMPPPPPDTSTLHATACGEQ